MIRLLDILQEIVEKTPIPRTIKQYQQYLDGTSLSYKNREYYQKIIDSVKKQVDAEGNHVASERQQLILNRIEAGLGGSSNYHPKNENKNIHEPSKPGILKKRLGKLSCGKVSKERSKLKDKSTHYAKALQRYKNYHC